MGGGVFGKPVLSPDSLCGKENVCVLICTPQPKFITEIKFTLDKLKLENYLLEEAVLKNHKKEVLQVYDMLCDKKSKDIYANMIYCRLEGLYPEHDLFTENQYFCWTDFTSKDTGSSFVDCGAYVGDSMERYIWYKDGVVKKIICLEPDKRNFSAMQKRAARLKEEWNLSDAEIQLFPYGVSDVSTEGVVESYSDNNGLGSKITQDVTEGDAIKIVALDDVINEKVDFIKADIESYEYKCRDCSLRLAYRTVSAVENSIMHIIWDLDGTLIDSEKDILLSLEKAITGAGVSLSDMIEPLRIGPPVDVMIDNSFGIGAITDDVKSKIISNFREIYDNSEFENTKFFAGIENILADKNFAHHIITNKPSLPTQRVLEKLDAAKYFASVMSPNSMNAEKRMSKQEMFAYLKNQFPREKFIGIGDMPSDCTAALQNGLEAVGVLWGTGTEDELIKIGCSYIVKDVFELNQVLHFIFDSSI